MRELHPIYAAKWESYARPWYAGPVFAAPYQPKPVVYPQALKRHPEYTMKWRSMMRPHYVSPPIQPLETIPINTYIAPNLQPTNPAITYREDIRNLPWQYYRPYRDWPPKKPDQQVNV